MANKTKQTDRVVNYLKSHPEGITGAEAWSELGIIHLSSRITDIVKDGYNVVRQREKIKNRFGEVCYVMRYKF